MAVAFLVYGISAIVLSGVQAMKVPLWVVMIIGGLVGCIAAGLAWKHTIKPRVPLSVIDPDKSATKNGKTSQPIVEATKQKIDVAEKRALTVALADCTFDVILEISENGLQTFRRAFPGDKGTLTAIFHIYERGTSSQQNARLLLQGNWQGTSGFIVQSLENLTIFIMSERQFQFRHMKPIIEYTPITMTHFSSEKQYVIELTAFPGFATPLTPKQINIRTREGLVFPVVTFEDIGKAWYRTVFSLKPA